jgi:hypothetical protein
MGKRKSANRAAAPAPKVTNQKGGSTGRCNFSKSRKGATNVYKDIYDLLANHGLRIVQIKADGNCFFRAVVDQVEVCH